MLVELPGMVTPLRALWPALCHPHCAIAFSSRTSCPLSEVFLPCEVFPHVHLLDLLSHQDTKALSLAQSMHSLTPCLAGTPQLSLLPNIVLGSEADRSLAVSCPLCSSETVTSAPALPQIVHEPIKCTCSMQGTGFSCPSGVGGHPPQMKVVTGDILADITGRNVSEYLLYTSDRFRLHRQEGGGEGLP